ncbi:MAG: L-serine ammonia-lyase, iron-sulfur-dependent subunit beta [Eubacteriales bacterium]
MNTSIFQVAGPIMIGPSSSHTAGAAKIGKVARQIVNSDFDCVKFGLFGSFDKTGKGHGTDRALLAGVLGMDEYDENIPKSFEIAHAQGIEFDFHSVELDGAHENTAVITFYKAGEKKLEIQAASTGGGNIRIEKIDGYEIGVNGMLPTIFVRQNDKKGVISHVTTILAENDINVATMKVSRSNKSEEAICVIEIDSTINSGVVEKLKDYEHIRSVRLIEFS